LRRLLATDENRQRRHRPHAGAEARRVTRWVTLLTAGGVTDAGSFPRVVWRLAASLLAATLLAATLLAVAPARAAEAAEVTNFEVGLDEEGVSLSYSLNFELTRAVEDALNKGVPLFFLAEAEVYQSRWYWRDRRVGHATRLWRIAYQPLTSSYRVTFGGLNLNYNTPAEAFAAMRRTVRWKVAEAGQIDPGKSHYVEFSFRLDTTLLPRPMQIGISGQPEWALTLERSARVGK
jgi:hypothetical protein